MPSPISVPEKFLNILLQTSKVQAIIFSIFVIFFIRRLYFSPLSHLPGPFATALTSKYITLLTHFNRRTLTIHEWHNYYGPIVRISPIEVSVISPQGVKEIYSDPTYGKYAGLYGIFQHFGEQNSFSSGSKEEHGWRRKAISDRYTMSFVLREEGKSGKILRVVREYLDFIQEAPPTPTNYSSRPKHTNGPYKVDLYTANSFFATDAVTSHLFGPRNSTRSLAGNEGDREMINAHYRGARRSKIHLKTEFPKLMAFTEDVGSLYYLWKNTIRTCLFQKSEPTRIYVGGSRIDDYGWHAYQKVKAEGNRDGHVHVAEKLAALVRSGPDIGNNGRVWSDRGAASEVMVS